MSDLIDDPTPGQNAHEFTVTEISGAIKRVIEGEFGQVRIKGEVGRVSRPRSGHVYLDLKDDRSVISGVIWKGVSARLATQPEEGMEVVASGKVTTFAGQSKYQIVIDDIRPAGVGALMAMLEKRKKALEAEGLFDPARKQPLPFLPEVIGVVTSPSGAVIRDILHRLRDRFPCKVLIWPVAVQGQAAAGQVAAAIAGFNRLTPGGKLPRPDVLIVARGGGSLEDLWAFNEEVVARAVAASDIPLISAVGHETDTTLIDFVSDHRAPTPTAAAERAVPVRLDLLAWLDGQGARLSRAASEATSRRRQRLADLSRALPRPETLLSTARQRLDLAEGRLPQALRNTAARKRLRLVEVSANLSPRALKVRLATARQQLHDQASRAAATQLRQSRDNRRAFGAASDRLRPALLHRPLAQKRRDLSALGTRLSVLAQSQTTARRAKLDAIERLRSSLGYEATLSRGYAVVRGDGDVVMSAKAAAKADALEIQFRDGRLPVGGSAAPSPPPKKPAKKPPPGQGSLF
ncbi:MAG: exodeoxyribonuclease VII large subunit [Rhodobacteraceae bacterium]|nr:exodeoxyribonuclease VII large subunit [Paracoccaceae bacterium]